MEMWLRLAAHASVGILEANQAVYRRHGSNMALIYYKEHCLGDLQQRKAAIDLFFQTCSYALPDAQKLRRTLHWHLSREVFRRANTAFNKGEMELSEQLSDLALDIYPEAKISLRWVLLACKRSLGFRVWCIFLPVEALINKAASTFKLLVKKHF
jgi:hypothetical protein